MFVARNRRFEKARAKLSPPQTTIFSPILYARPRLSYRSLSHIISNCLDNFSLRFIFAVLFHRAILLSGSPLSPLSLVRDPVYYGHQVAKLVNCSPDLQHLHLLNCLRDTPLDQLLNAQLHVPEFTTAFGPSVDGVIIDVGTAAESSRLGAQSSE